MQLFEFIGNHWPLVAAFVVLLLLLVFYEVRIKAGSAIRVNPAQATQLINKDNAVVVDIRDQHAYENGHIVDAWHILPADILNHEKLAQHKDKPVLITDQAGYHAQALGRQLRRQGFTQVYCLAGGINNWLNSSLLLTKGK